MASALQKLLAPPAKRPTIGAGLYPLLGGAALFAVLFRLLVWPDIAIGLYWTTAPCEVLDGRVAESSDSDGSTYRAEIKIRYEAQGATREIWSTRGTGAYSSGKSGKVSDIEKFPPGAPYTCWVNPEKPGEAVILRGGGGELLFLFFPLLFVGVGLRSIYYSYALRKKSEEEIRLAAQGGSATYIPPSVLKPGRYLSFDAAYNRDLSGSILLTIVSAVLSAFAAIFVFLLTTGKVGGVGFAVLLLFLLVIGGLALLLWVDLLGRLRVALRVPAVVIEVSESPIRPGTPFELFVKQPKPSQIMSFAVDLLCEEAATSGRDSDSSTTKTHEVYTQSVFPAQPLAGAGKGAFTHQCRVELPAEAMHSFDAPSNKITWKIVVSGETLGGVRFRREAPIVVHPPKPERIAGYRDARVS